MLLLLTYLTLFSTSLVLGEDVYHSSHDAHHRQTLNDDWRIWRNETKDFWMNDGGEELKKALKIEKNNNVARNIILFIGDGMSLNTVTGIRVYKTQLGKVGSGEDGALAWDEFPNVALSKVLNKMIISNLLTFRYCFLPSPDLQHRLAGV